MTSWTLPSKNMMVLNIITVSAIMTTGDSTNVAVVMTAPTLKLNVQRNKFRNRYHTNEEIKHTLGSVPKKDFGRTTVLEQTVRPVPNY